MAFDPGQYTSNRKQRHIPVILLLDVSGSMSGDPIDSLNSAVQDMFATFCDDKIEKPIKVAIITFGANGAQLHLPPTPARDANAKWRNMNAAGTTPLGSALKMAKDMVEDTTYMPKDEYYKGYFILASDGDPKDSWEEPMRRLINDGRTRKYDRFALAIGDKADEAMLGKFIEGSEYPLFHANTASDIEKAIKAISEPISERASEKDKPSGKNEEAPERKRRERPQEPEQEEW